MRSRGVDRHRPHARAYGRRSPSKVGAQVPSEAIDALTMAVGVCSDTVANRSAPSGERPQLTARVFSIGDDGIEMT